MVNILLSINLHDTFPDLSSSSSFSSSLLLLSESKHWDEHVEEESSPHARITHQTTMKQTVTSILFPLELVLSAWM